MKKTHPEYSEAECFLLFVIPSVRRHLATDELLLRGVLDQLPGLIGMRSITEPLITRAYSNPGLEGYVAIDTSNIAVSTYEDPPRVVGSIHSCRPFNEIPVLDFVRDTYESDRVYYRLLDEADLDCMHSSLRPLGH